jgi:hypothetical protein
MQTLHSSAAGWRRFAACLCLLSWIQAAGFVPSLLALAASLEGSHQVNVAWGGGEIAVVLHHAEVSSSPHQHGPASKVLCSLGNSVPGSRADHVVSFVGHSTCEESVRPSRGDSDHRKINSVLLVLSALSRDVRPSSVPPEVTRFVAMDSTPLHALRTTVLLI